MSLYDLRCALVTLYDGDSAVQAITGRAVGNLVLRGTSEAAKTPVATYFVASAPEPGGTNQRRRAIIQIDIWGNPEEGTTIADLHTMMDRAETLFTGTNLAGVTPSVDAAVFKGSVRDAFPLKDETLLSIGQDFTFELAV